MMTPQREKFAQLVASGKSQAEAYRTAYPRSQKWKDAVVWNKGSELVRVGEVSVRIKELQAEIVKEFVIDTRSVLVEAYRLATSDIAKIMDENGRVKLPHELDPDTRAAVASFEIDEYGRIKYKFWDKNSAIERMFKHKGLFEIDNRQKTDPLLEMLRTLPGKVIGPVMIGPASAGDVDDDEGAEKKTDGDH